jgi:AcrR family transcriptional regulator
VGRNSIKDVRQKEIVKAFYTVSKKLGLENTSLAKVADHMKINPSLIVHYFQSRDHLISGLIQFTLEQYSDIYKMETDAYTSSDDLNKLIDNLFSRKWNRLFDDGVFYSCYALTYQNKKIRSSFKELHDSLRKMLLDAIQKASRNGVIKVKNEKETTEIIFALLEGAYYYLGMVDSKAEYNSKVDIFKQQARRLLGI